VLLLLALLVVGAFASDWTSAVRELQGKVKGQTIVPGHPAYDEATLVFSPRHNNKPAVVVIPKDIADVQAAMGIAQKHSMEFRVGSGHHNYEGYSLVNDGMLLSLRSDAWRKVVINADGTVTVRGGAQLIDVHRTVIPQGLGVVAGLCPSVGIVPFTLGGGYGSLSRAVGLSADNVVSFLMVLANGTVTRVSEDEHSCLFWAMRGGGGGNLGVVVEMTIRTHQLPEGNEMMMGETCWDWSRDGHEVFNWWANMATSAATPREFTMSLRSHYGPLDQFTENTTPENTPQQLCVQPFYYGTAAEGAAFVKSQFAQLPEPVSDKSVAQNWLVDVEHEHEKVLGVYGLNVYIKSGFFITMPLSLVSLLHTAIENAPSIGNCIIDFDHLSGAITDVEPTETAYVNRNASVNIQIIATWMNGDERMNEYITWADALFESTAPYMSGNYVNYIDSNLPNWQQRYYGENYARLQHIKAAIDPTRFFNGPQSIES